MDKLADDIRHHVIEMVYRAQAAHGGSSLSMCEILAALYGDVLREKDTLLISKGHAAATVYAALALTGHIPMEMLETFFQDDSLLQGHTSHHVPGIKLSTGSLGHALPVSVGLALGKPEASHYVILSDGELNEGSNWEALLFAPKHVSNLNIVIDYNKLQSLGTTEEVLDLEPLADKLRAFGWNPIEVDGHDTHAIASALRSDANALIAHTIKGKGIPELENTLAAHYKPPTQTQYEEHLRAHSLH